MNNSTDKSSEVSDWTSPSLYPEYQAAMIIYKVFVPCLLLLGGFGNIATIFVMQHTKDPSSSQHVFLTALAVADFVCLYIAIFPRFLLDYFNVHFWNLHWMTCKLYFWVGYSSVTLSAWLLTAVTIQRTLAVKWPHKIRVMCTIRRTWFVVTCLVIIACVLHSHFLVTFGAREGMVCSPPLNQAGYMFFSKYVLTWLNLCINSFLPFACLLVCDVILSLTLFRAVSVPSVPFQDFKHVQTMHSTDSRQETARRTSIMVLVLSLTFLILTMPQCVVVLWHNLEKNEHPSSFARMLLIRSITECMVYTNNAVNFLLYCFTGTRFRREFFSWICCSTQK